MCNKHKKSHKKSKKTQNVKQPKLLEKNPIKLDVSNVFESDSEPINHLNYKNINKKNIPIINSYPVGILGPLYSIQTNKRPDINKYFQNDKYTYNVQMSKPVLTYGNYVTQKTLSNMTPQEHKYYQQFQQHTYNFNGTYDVVNKKPAVLAIQSNLHYPMFSGGPNINETNGQIGYTPQPTQSTPSQLNVSPGTLGPNGGTVQIYGNSPAYTGVQANTLPGENIIENMNAQQTKANNANINNPAYFNYGQYYY